MKRLAVAAMAMAAIAMAAIAAMAVALAGCRRDPEPLGPHDAFVPVTLRSTLSGRIPWRTHVVLTNPGGSPSTVRVMRWPPDRAENEVADLVIPAGGTQAVPPCIPAFPSIASLTFSSAQPFLAAATIEVPDGSRPSLDVPVFPTKELALEGDRLLVPGFVKSREERSHFGFTFPWSEHDAVPFRVRCVFTAPGGHEISRREHAIHGVPQVIEDPWLAYALPGDTPFDLEVTLLGSTRGRRAVKGLWVYGIVQDKASGVSRFLTTRVFRTRNPMLPYSGARVVRKSS